MNNKFLDKVIDQILSETIIIDNKLHTPFTLPLPLFSPSRFFFSLYTSPPLFSSHCKDVYSLNEQEIDYVWNEYRKEVTTLIDKKELTHQEGMG